MPANITTEVSNSTTACPSCQSDALRGHGRNEQLIRAWTNWQPWIIKYFEHPVTNAYTESLNSLIRVMNRLGRGYSFEALRAKILFTEGAHKHKLSRPKFERKREPVPVRGHELFADDSVGYGLPTLAWILRTRPPLHRCIRRVFHGH